ncbi:MAG: hypothetical protein DRP81_08840, partial [Candidatus Omnitrophota bacterium]
MNYFLPPINAPPYLGSEIIEVSIEKLTHLFTHPLPSGFTSNLVLFVFFTFLSYICGLRQALLFPGGVASIYENKIRSGSNSFLRRDIFSMAGGVPFARVNNLDRKYFFTEDGGISLDTSTLKQIASFLREGRLSEGNIQPKWYEIATDKGNSRLGFILDVSDSDLEKYLFKIKPYLENKKAVIFVGMGGSINTVKIMRKFFQDEKIIFIDTPDKMMIKGLMEEWQDKGISLKEIEVVAISKSATTFETHTIVNILKEIYTQNNLSFTQNLIWLIDLPNKDKLEEKGYDLDKLTIFPIQIDKETDIGGRFTAPKTSLFILPLFILLGCDIEKTIEVLDYIKELENTKSFKNNINDYIDLVVSKDKINSCIYLILPEEFKSIYEEVTTWITQLYQESLGGKVGEFDPKILVFLESQINPALEEKLQKQGLAGLDFRFLKKEEEDLIKKFISLSLYLEYIVLGIAYKYSFLNKRPLNFVTQPNVDEYKRIMKEIKELKEPQQIDISSLTSFVGNNLGESQKFVEIVYYGTDEDIYNRLKSIEEINKRFVLVFRGPDWNHHSFQAAYKAKHTLFVLLLDKYADENIKLIAYATSKALSKKALYRIISNDGGKVSQVAPDVESVKEADDITKEVIRVWQKEGEKVYLWIELGIYFIQREGYKNLEGFVKKLEVGNNEVSLPKATRLNRRLAQAGITSERIEILNSLATRTLPKRLLSLKSASFQALINYLIRHEKFHLRGLNEIAIQRLDRIYSFKHPIEYFLFLISLRLFGVERKGEVLDYGEFDEEVLKEELSIRGHNLKSQRDGGVISKRDEIVEIDGLKMRINELERKINDSQKKIENLEEEIKKLEEVRKKKELEKEDLLNRWFVRRGDIENKLEDKREFDGGEKLGELDYLTHLKDLEIITERWRKSDGEIVIPPDLAPVISMLGEEIF